MSDQAKHTPASPQAEQPAKPPENTKPAPPAQQPAVSKPDAPKGPGPAQAAPPKPAPAGQPRKSPNPVAEGGKAVSKPASTARMKRRHWGVISSFFIFVLLPIAAIGYYLWVYASDQYASTVAFSVRTEESSSALELLGGITDLSGSSSSDTDILYEFLQSQKLVSDIDALIDLRAIWSKPENDPIFAFDTDGTIEDLLEHWNRFVHISYDESAGLMEVRTNAFDPSDATLIAQTLYDESTVMINGLSDIAREDAIRYARQELDAAVEQLREARQAVTTFRNVNQLVDPTVDLSTQAGLMGSLEAQLAEALIELDMLPGSGPNDPRVSQARLRIDVIQRRIEEERSKLGGTGADSSEAYANLLGEYERLVVNREFAEQRYASSQLAYDSALAEARRQSRYLAAYVLPTTAESSRYPQRLSLLFIWSVFLVLVWSIGVLVLYAIKDRR